MSTIVNFLRTVAGQRFDNLDAQHAFLTAADAARRELGSELLATDNGARRHYVIDGFDMTDEGSRVLKVTRGRALAGRRDGGTVHYGVLIAAGRESISIDLSSHTQAVPHGIYVRFAYAEGVVENRTFWDAINTTEDIRATHTRYESEWQLVVQQVSPGDEWLKLGEVTIDASTITLIEKLRPFFFEGDEDSNTAASDFAGDEWGDGANDRSALREQYGVRDVATMFAAIRRQLRDIIDSTGSTRWYTDVAGAAIQGLTQKLNHDGSNDITGSLDVDTTDTHNLGTSTGSRFNIVYAVQAILDTLRVNLGVIELGEKSGGGEAEFILRHNSTTGGDTTKGRIVAASNGDVTIEAGIGASIATKDLYLRADRAMLAQDSDLVRGIVKATVTWSLTNNELDNSGTSNAKAIVRYNKPFSATPTGGSVNSTNARIIACHPDATTLAAFFAEKIFLAGYALTATNDEAEIHLATLSDTDVPNLGPYTLTFELIIQKI